MRLTTTTATHCSNSSTNPYTIGNRNVVNPSCGGIGPEQGFFIELQSDEAISIGMSWNDYDSVHELRYGGEYPGEISVTCLDDPDNEFTFFDNKERVRLMVFFHFARGWF
jgi:hypothetical protein